MVNNDFFISIGNNAIKLRSYVRMYVSTDSFRVHTDDMLWNGNLLVNFDLFAKLLSE